MVGASLSTSASSRIKHFPFPSPCACACIPLSHVKYIWPIKALISVSKHLHKMGYAVIDFEAYVNICFHQRKVVMLLLVSLVKAKHYKIISYFCKNCCGTKAEQHNRPPEICYFHTLKVELWNKNLLCFLQILTSEW